MKTEKQRQQRRAELLTADPSWDLAWRTHAILSFCYRTMHSTARYRMYEDAGVYELLRAAERRVDKQLRKEGYEVHKTKKVS